MQNHCIIQFFGRLKSPARTLKKMPLSMKLLFIILICSVGLGYASEGHAQKTSISLKATDCTVGEVLHRIQKESGFGFFINNKNIDFNRRVSVSASEKNILYVLDQVFAGTNVSYTIIDDKIVLAAKKKRHRLKGRESSEWRGQRSEWRTINRRFYFGKGNE